MISIFLNKAFYDKIAVKTEQGRQYSYRDLRILSSHICNHIQFSSLIFCLCKNDLGALVGYLAFVGHNIPAVMIDCQKGKDIIDNLISVYQPRYLWMPAERKHEFGGNIIKEVLGYVLIEREAKPYEIHPDVALLLTTSGSTGSPKLVKLTKENIISNARSIAQYLGITSSERPITSLPMYYSFGLSVINSHLIKGATILLTDKGVMQKEFWNFAKDAEATSISGVPYTYEMLKRLRFFRMELPKLKTLTQAGGKLNSSLAKEFIENSRACNKRFIVMYGQTEATARMSYLPEDVAAEKCTSIGIAIPGGNFTIIDSYGNEISDAEIDGELVYTGPNVSMGYAECIADLARGDENHGVLHTGDIARRDSDGYYYITGRMKRFVKVWGNRCNLDAIEDMLKSSVIIRQTTGNDSNSINGEKLSSNLAVTGIDDKITVFTTQKNFDTEIKTFLAEKTGLNTRAFSVKEIDYIPKNTSGKILYAELQKLLD